MIEEVASAASREAQAVAKSNSESMAFGSATGIAVAGGMVFAALAAPALAQVEGPQVVSGSASIQQQGSQTIIHAADNTIINYGRFDIRAGETVQFIQPDAFSRVLNRIASPEPTRIDGSLIANGQVYLVNPAGIVFGPGSVVNVGAIFAAAARMSDQDFLNGVDRFTGLAGSVENHGTINAGFAALVGRYVANYGSIDTGEGFITMASGDEVYIGELGGVLYARVATPAKSPEAAAEEPAVKQAGSLSGRRINLASGDVLALAITGGSSITGEEVRIQGGSVRVSGEIDVSSQAGRGGSVEVLGDIVVVDRATIDASGTTGGGTILIGGDYRGGFGVPTAWRTGVSRGSLLVADATGAGDGGKVIVWADDTAWFYGHISARGGATGGDGGFIEVSGKDTLVFRGTGDTSAPFGVIGQLLLDPATLTIIDAAAGGDHDGDLPDILAGAANIGGNTVSWGAIDALAASSTVILEATGLVTINNVTGAAGGTITSNNLVMLDLTSAGSLTIRSTGGAVTFADTADTIRTEGAGITIEALGGNLTAGRLNTSGAAGNATGGGITLTASGSISADNLTTAGGVVSVTGVGVTLADVSTVGASGTQPGGNVAANSGTGTLSLGAITVANAAVSLTGDEINPASAISNRAAGSTLSFQPSTASTSTRLASGATGNLDLTAAELNLIAPAGGANIAWQTISFGNAAGTANLLLVGDYTFANNLVESDSDSFIQLLAGGVAAVQFNATFDMDVGNNSILIRADEFNLNTDASVAGTAALVIEPNTAGDGIRVASATAPSDNVLDLQLGELNRIVPGFSSWTIGRSDGTGVLELGTNTASFVFPDPVTFRSPSGTLTTVAAIDTSGALTFEAAATVAANVTVNGAFTSLGDFAISANIEVDTGANTITFADDVDLNGNTLTLVSGGVTFTGAPQLGGTLSAAGQGVTFEGTVTLGAATLITAGTATFEDDVDLASFSLGVAANEIDITGGGTTVSGTGGGALTLGPASAATIVEVAGSTTTGGLDLTAAELATLQSSLSSVTIQTGASGVLNVRAAPGLSTPLTLTSATGIVIHHATVSNNHDLTFAGPVTFNSSLGVGPANLSALGTNRTLAFNSTLTGNAGLAIQLTADEINLAGSVSAPGGGELFLRPDSDIDVDLGGAVNTTPSLLEITAAEAALITGYSRVVVGSATSTQTLTVSGATVFSTPVTLRSGTGDLQINASLQVASGASNSQLIADDIDFGASGAVTGAGTLVIFPATAGLNVDLAGSGVGGLDLTAAEIAKLTGTFTNVVFGQTGVTPNVGIGANMPSLASPVEFRATTLITVEGSYSNGDDITFSGPTQINASATIAAGSTIDFNSTLAVGTNNLTLQAGEVDFGGAVTGTGSLTIRPDLAGIQVVLGGNNNATGALDLTDTELNFIADGFTLLRFGAATLTSGVTVIADRTFTDAVEFLGGTGTVAFNADVGMGANNLRIVANSFDIDTVNGSLTGAGGSLTLEAQTASHALRFGGANTAGTLALSSAEIGRLNGAFSLLTFGRSDGTGNITLPVAVDLTGASVVTPILFETGSGTILVNAAITNPDDLTFAGPTTLSSNVFATGSTLTFNNPVTVSATSEVGGSLVDFDSTVAAGTNALTVSGDEIDLAGAVSGTGNLTLRQASASRPVEVGGGSTNAAALSLLAAELNLLSNGWNTVTIGRANATSDLTFAGAYSFASSLTNNGLFFLSGTGTIDVANAVGFGANSVSFIADNIENTAGVSGTGTLALSPQTAGLSIDVGSPAVSTGGLDLSDTLLSGISGFSLLTIGDGTARPIRVDTATVAVPTRLTTTGSFTLEDDALPGFDVTGGLEIDAPSAVLGANVVAGAFEATGGLVVADGRDILIDTSASNGTIDVAATIEGVAGGTGESIEFDSGTGGITVGGIVSGAGGTALSSGLFTLVLVDAGNVTLAGTQLAGQLATTNALTGTFQSSGLLRAGSINLAGVVFNVNAGFETTASATFTNSGMFSLGADSQSLGTVLVSGASSLGANVTSSGDMTFQGPITLLQNVTLTVNGLAGDDLLVVGTVNAATAGLQALTANAGAGNATFQAPIGATDALSVLDIDAASVFLANIGSGSTPGVTLITDVNATGSLTFTGTNYRANTQTYTAGSGFGLAAGAPTLFVSSGDPITFAGSPLALGNGSHLTVQTFGGTIAVGDIDGDSAEDIILTAGSGGINVGAIGSGVGIRNVQLSGNSITLNGNIRTGGQPGNDVTITGNTILGNSITINTDGVVNDGVITFDGFIDGTTVGGQSLTTRSGSANTIFEGIGGGISLLSLDAAGASITLANTTTSGNQAYAGNVLLGGALNSGGGGIAITGNTTLLSNSTIATNGGGFLATGTTDGAFTLAINAGAGGITLQGAAGGGTPLAGTTFSGNTIEVAGVITTGAQSYTGLTDLSGSLSSEAAPITITGNTILRNNIVINTAADGAGAGANLLLTGAINSINGSQSLTVGTGTTGGAIFGGAIGANSPLAALSITGNTLDLTGLGEVSTQGVTGATLVQVAGNLTFTGNTYNAGAQNYDAASFLFGAGSAVSVSSNGQNLAFNNGAITLADGSDLILTTGNAGDLLFGNVVGNSGESFSASAGGALTAGTIGGGAQIANLTLAGGTLSLQGITANGTTSLTGAVLFNQNVSLLGDSTITGNTTLAQDLTFTSGPNSIINFNGTINGTTAGADDLTFSGGSGARLIISGATGSGVRLGALTFGGFDTLDVGALRATTILQSAGTTTNTFRGAIDTSGAGGATFLGGIFSFQGPITVGGGGSFAVTGSQNITFLSNSTVDGAFTQAGTTPTVFIRGVHAADSYSFAANELKITQATTISTAASGADLVLPRLGGSQQFDLTLNAGLGDIILPNGVGVVGDPLGSLVLNASSVSLGAVGTPNNFGVAGFLTINANGSVDLTSSFYRSGIATTINSAGPVSFTSGSPITFLAPGGAAFNAPTVALFDGSDLTINTSGGNGPVVLPDVTGVSHEALAVTAGTGPVTLGIIGSNSADQIRIVSVEGGALTLNGGIFTSNFDGNRVILSGSSITLGQSVTIDTENSQFDGRISLTGAIDDSTPGSSTLVLNAGTKTTLGSPLLQETEPETSLESTLTLNGSIGATNRLAAVELRGRLIHLVGDTSVIRAAGDIAFNPVDRGGVADHATIIRFRSDGSGGVSTDPAGLTIQTDGRVVFGSGHKLVVLGDLLIGGVSQARAQEAVLSDIVTLGSMTVRAETITANARAASEIQTVDVNAIPPFNFTNPLRILDAGPDFVAAQNIDFDFASAPGITDALFATNASGTVLGALASIVTPFVYEPTFSRSDLVQNRSADQTRFLDLRAQGNPDLNIAETVAASIPRETRTNEVSQQASISAADQQDLTRLGITVKTAADLVGMLQSPFLILVDMPEDRGSAGSGISAQRLARTPVVEAVDSFYLLMYENLPTDPRTGRPLRDENGAVVTEGASGRAESIQRGLQDAYSAYTGTLAGADPTAAGFLAFIQASTLDQVRADIASLSALFRKIDNLGLTPAEADQSKDYILRLVRRARGGIPADVLRGVIEGWSTQ